jgi:hypothetical protein
MISSCKEHDEGRYKRALDCMAWDGHSMGAGVGVKGLLFSHTVRVRWTAFALLPHRTGA